MNSPAQHVLVVGGGSGAIRAVRPETRTTFLTLMALLPRFRSLTHHQRVVAIQGDEPDEVLIELAASFHELDPFDAVACLGEPLTLTAAKIAAALGLSGVPPLEVASLITNKSAMRVRLREAGLEDVQSRVVSEVDELKDVVNSRPGSTWIVKPATGSGSLGISKVTLGSDLDAALERALTSQSEVDPERGPQQVLVEEFLTGVQYSVEAVTEAGTTTILGITQKFSDPESFVELGHVIPAPLEQESADEIGRHVQQVLAALGVTDSVTHTEIVMTPDGPRTVETHTRIGGDDIFEMASIVSGVELSPAGVDLALGISLQPRLEAARPSGTCEAIWFLSSPEAGLYAGLDGIDEAKQVDASIAVTELLSLGDQVELLASSDSRVAQVRASAPSAELAIERAREAADRLTLKIAHAVTPDVRARGTL